MGTIRKIAIAGVVAGVMVFANFVYGSSEASETQAEVKLQQVALFKNGLGFFVSEAAVPKKKKEFHVVPFAAASHGTFWVAYPEKVKLKSLVVKETEVEELIEAISIAELLKANVGKKVKLYFPDPDEPMVEGKILYFAQDREKPKPQPYAPGGIGQVINPRGGEWRSRLVIINTANGQVGINPDIVRRVDFPNSEPIKAFAQKKRSMQLDIQLGAHADGQKLLVSYLGKGVTWAPSYVVDISKEEKAQISAKAAVINEVCDLEDVTLQLVTGFPHLQFADVVSPLALKENLAQFLQSLIRGQSERGRGAAVMYNVAAQSVAWSMREERADVMPSYGAAEGGKVSEDLFFYPLEKVQLAKGQVGYFPLFTETVPYKHIYQWNIPDYVNQEDRYRRRRRDEQEGEPEEEVWHSVRLENVSKIPWTTAPAQILKDDLILGQDTLKYTPVQGETTVRITRAVSVKAEQVEFEIERKRDAMRMYGDHFDLITVQGKLSVTNFLPKPITLEITKTLSGEVKSSQPEAKIEKLARGLRRVNTTAKLTWTIELKTDEHKEIGYTYDVYVRR